jgi:O-acetyl-ADP-ribose deacetylase (regulator of RNase III)
MVVDRGGDIIQQESDQFIREHGELESGMVAMTAAGSLPFEAIIHAVGPRMGEGGEREKVSMAVSNALKLCHMHDWATVAFPAISTGIFAVPVETVARGFYRAITSFWDARIEGAPNKIIICLTNKNFSSFFDAFRQASMQPEEEADMPEIKVQDKAEPETGIVELDDKEIASLDDDDVNDWFK